MIEMHNAYRKPVVVSDDSGLAFPTGTPYKGVVPSANFIGGSALSTAVGLTTGTLLNDAAGWLHFIESSGLEIYIAKKPIRKGITNEEVIAATSNGAKEVTINGDVYLVTLPSGATVNPAGVSDGGGDWNRYMYNVYTMADRQYFPAGTLHWGDYTAAMLGVGTFRGSTEDGSESICLEASTSGGKITRGLNAGLYANQNEIMGAWYNPANTTAGWIGWRPKLIKKSTIPPSPYIGELASASFISGSALATAVGLSTGTLVNNTTPWLKFVDAGKTFYMPKMIIRTTITWTQLNTLGLILGTKTVVINGLTYKVRVMTGGAADPSNTAGGEYNNYFLRVTNAYPGSDGAWAANTPTDMGWLGGTTSGEMIICKEVSTQGGHLLRGYPGFAGVWYEPDDTAYTAYGWRPVLELVP